MPQQPYVLKTDRSIIVLSKPPGMSVHATNPGEDEGTLVAWLAALDPFLEKKFPKVEGELWRPGIVHRLDKDTSGVMVVARTPEALKQLQNQFRNRSTEKVYRAISFGVTDSSGEFSGLISRSDDDPTKQETKRLSFSWSKGTPREAETTYQRLGLNKERGVSLVELHPKTVRMHQLRVQLADAGWPILGDDRYGTKPSQRLSEELGIERQMLHAMKLTFEHPETGERKTYCMGYPQDFLRVLETLSLPVEAC